MVIARRPAALLTAPCEITSNVVCAFTGIANQESATMNAVPTFTIRVDAWRIGPLDIAADLSSAGKGTSKPHTSIFRVEIRGILMMMDCTDEGLRSVTATSQR